MCESEFLRSFFRSNLSNSSITIANDSNSPNRQVNTSGSSEPRSPSLIFAQESTNTTTTTITKTELNENKPTVDSNKDKNITTTIEAKKIDESLKQPTSDNVVVTNSTPNVTNNTTTTTTSTSTNNNNDSKKTSSNQTKQNRDRTIVSVANLLNNSNLENNNKMASRPSTSNNFNEQQINHQYLINNSTSNNNNNNSRPNSNSSTSNLYLPNNAMINYHQHPIQVHPPFHQYNPYINPLSLPFQPIPNMIISPQCPSPSQQGSTAGGTISSSGNVANSQSLNNSRPSSPWMPMPPPPPLPLQQQFYVQPYNGQIIQTNRSHSSSSRNNMANFNKDSSKINHFNTHFSMMNGHDEVKLLFLYKYIYKFG